MLTKTPRYSIYNLFLYIYILHKSSYVLYVFLFPKNPITIMPNLYTWGLLGLMDESRVWLGVAVLAARVIVVIEDGEKGVLLMCDSVFIRLNDGVEVLSSLANHVLGAFGRTSCFKTNATVKVTHD